MRRTILGRPYRINRAWGAVSLIAPTISTITPAIGSTAGGTAITDLHGFGFIAGTPQVFFGGYGGVGGTLATGVVRVSPNKITCVTPAGPDSGLQSVSVNALLGTYTRLAGSFLTDRFFVGQSVQWSGFANAGNNGVKIITALTATVMTVSPAGLVLEAATGDERVILNITDVVVINPDTSESGSTGFGKFTYTAVAVPVVNSVTPNTGSEAGGTSITVGGMGFQNGALVYVNQVLADNIVFVSSTEIDCDTPEGDVGSADILVVNPDTQDSGTSGNDLFTYTSAFAISSLPHSWLAFSENYSAGVLPGTASAAPGTSGTHDFSGGVSPGVGRSYNGLASIDCNGTTQYLSSAPAHRVDFMGPSAYSGWICYELRDIQTDATGASAYTDEAILAEAGGYWAVANRRTGPKAIITNYPDSSETTMFGTTSIDVGSDGANLPQAIIFVVSTAGMPTSGTFRIITGGGLHDIISYTGISGNSLTGCTGGAAGHVLATGQVVLLSRLQYTRFRFQGGILEIGINGDPMVATPATDIDVAGNAAIFLGKGFSAAFNGEFLAGGFSEPGQALFTDGDFTNILGALRAKYAEPLI